MTRPADDDFDPQDADSTQPQTRDVDEPYNAADREQIKAKKRTQKQIEREQDEVMAALLQHPNGRRWLATLIFETCGLNAPLQDQDYRTDAIHFKEGSRRVAILLQSQALRVNRKNYIMLLDEHLGAK